MNSVKSRSIALASGMAISICAAPALGQERTATWDAGSGDWSTPANWDPEVVPCNFGAFRFTANVPPAVTVSMNAVNCQVSALNLGTATTEPTLRLEAGASLDVLTMAAIYGNVVAVDASALDAPMAMFPGDKATASVTGGSRFRAGATSYSSKGYWADACCSSFLRLWPLLTSSGAESVLDLSAVTVIDAGFDSVGDDRDYHQITAADGGLIDLSGVETITMPNDSQDRVELNVGAGGDIHLDSLASLAPIGNGYALLNVEAAELSLPAIAMMSQVIFEVTDGGSIAANGPSPASYSSLGFSADACCSSFLRLWPLMNSSGPVSVLDLSAVTTIDAGFNSTGDDRDYQQITASDGGFIDLSGVETITTPNDIQDRVELSVGAGGAMALNNLTSLASIGSGYAWLDVEAAELSLPAITTMSQVVFEVAAGGSIAANGPSPASYSSLGFSADACCSSFLRLWPLMSSSGPGAVLDLSAVTTIDAGFNSTGDDRDYHQITASDGGLIDLSGLESITAPTDSQDQLQFMTTGSVIDLSSLAAITSAGSGLATFTLNGGVIDLSSLATIEKAGSGVTPFTLNDAASTLYLGSLQSSDVGPVSITINHEDAAVHLAGSLHLGASITITDPTPTSAARGPILTIGGDFSYEHTDEASTPLASAVVGFDGAGEQVMEVGGLDVGVFVSAIPNDNFGFAQLRVGAPGAPTTVRLIDLVDNGNTFGGTVPEALYLWGNYAPTVGPQGDPMDGLQILGGSTLSMGVINAYAWLDGDWVRLGKLFKPGQERIAFGDGFLERVPCYADCDGNMDTDFFDFLCFQNEFAAGLTYADCDDSGSLDFFDFLCFQNAFAGGCQ